MESRKQEKVGPLVHGRRHWMLQSTVHRLSKNFEVLMFILVILESHFNVCFCIILTHTMSSSPSASQSIVLYITIFLMFYGILLNLKIPTC